jgi:predicted HicB family RNase H-like nuclease
MAREAVGELAARWKKRETLPDQTGFGGPKKKEWELMKLQIDKYTYRTQWSEEDEVFLCRCLEFNSIVTHGDSTEQAIKECKKAVRLACDVLRESRKDLPLPFGVQHFSGKFQVRITEDVHRELVTEAAEQGVSLNHLVSMKLAR